MKILIHANQSVQSILLIAPITWADYSKRYGGHPATQVVLS